MIAGRKHPGAERLLETIETRSACPVEEFTPAEERRKRALMEAHDSEPVLSRESG